MASHLPRIVVVDDEPAIAEMVCAILEDEGLHAICLTKGKPAFETIRGELPAVVILDVQMPVVTGIEIFRQMRADPLTALIPVIFLTANEHFVPLQLPDFRAQRAWVLSKPFNMTMLLSLVLELLAEQK
jgi:CheY-like chemotaxis protein